MDDPARLPTIDVSDESPTQSFAFSGRVPATGETLQRLLPGTRFGERYRIIEMLGRGATGEVYRAEDLQLGQPVALKFLPAHLTDDAGARARVRNEVRIARQVTHPNVCRVFDLGEVDGQVFISMEYVDGEDLRSVLRRLGRPSHEKALEIARQICAGLGAAHDIGVLHRDLKAANIMIDGRGRVRITDFGLASFVHEAPGADVAGTPAYMAPELFMGSAPSTRTDVYSLGAVLYELFTGHPAFAAETISELRRLQIVGTPVPPTQFVPELDPGVEAVILRCLDADPSERPPSAYAAAAVLPGGDPVTAAIAAGETPSPEMVAAAGGEGALRRSIGLACLSAVVVGLLAIAALNNGASMTGAFPPGKPPIVLADRAREIVAKAGHAAPGVESAYGYMVYKGYIEHVATADTSVDRWTKLGGRLPRPYGFWYRESPIPMVPYSVSGEIRYRDPPLAITSMAGVVTDDEGRLQILEIVPPQRDPTPAATTAPDYSQLFAAAGLDARDFVPQAPEWNPLLPSDTRSAWTGHYPGQPETAVRVEAAGYRGKPVYFNVVEAFDTAPRDAQNQRASLGSRAAKWTNVILLVAAIVVPPIVARRNLRRGVGDRRGAFRIGLAVALLEFVAWSFRSDTLSSFHLRPDILAVPLGYAVLYGIMSGLIYLALEPYVRRYWPRTLISWTRLLMGRIGDPRVGRDVLFGAVAGVLVIVIQRLEWWAPALFGAAPRIPYGIAEATLHGGGKALALLVEPKFLGGPLMVFFVLTAGMLLLRRRWLAVVVTLILFMLLDGAGVVQASEGIAFASGVVEIVLVWAVIVATLLRFGLLALASSFFFFTVLQAWPLTLDASAWYGSTSLLASAMLVCVAGIALLGARGGAVAWRRAAVRMT